MGGDLSCHYCGEPITEDDLLSNPTDFCCPHCNAGNDRM